MARMENEKIRVTLEPEWIFSKDEGKELLKSFSTLDDSTDSVKVDHLRIVLGVIKDEYGNRENASENFQTLWRGDRIKLYNTLIPLALRAGGQEWSLWKTVEYGSFHSKLESGKIYTYLLEYIHENDDIMFKYYQSKKPLLSGEANFWLQESMDGYFVKFIGPILKALEVWNEEESDVCGVLLDEAKEAFKKNLKEDERSWRYKVRMYWLLSRAMHAPISGGKICRYKTSDYVGPVYALFKKVIVEDNETLLEKDGDLLIECAVKKSGTTFDTKKNKLGLFKFSSLLAHASAAGEHVLVRCILQSKVEYAKDDGCDFAWVEKWKEAWAHALLNAAYKGRERVVEELYKYCELRSTDYYVGKQLPLPLHVAVHRKHISVVIAFTNKDWSTFSCHEEDCQFQSQTPLEVATNLDHKSTKKKIQSILLQTDEVKHAVEGSYRQREMTVNSANAIMVGAALIASVTYAGWLQPPLGYHSYYQFTEPVPAAPDAPLSYMFVQGHTTIRVFAVFNSLSFFFAIAAIVAGMQTYCFIENLEETYFSKTVRELQNKLKHARILFVLSVTSVLIAFASAGIAILPPIKLYQRDMYLTICVGGSICLVFIGRMLVSRKIKEKLEKMLSRLKQLM